MFLPASASLVSTSSRPLSHMLCSPSPLQRLLKSDLDFVVRRFLEVNIMMFSWGAKTVDLEQKQTGVEAFKVESLTEKIFTSGTCPCLQPSIFWLTNISVLASNPLQPSLKRSLQLNTTARLVLWQLVAATILVSFPVRFPSLRQWLAWWWWINCWFRTLGKPQLHYCPPLQPCLQPWLCLRKALHERCRECSVKWVYRLK